MLAEKPWKVEAIARLGLSVLVCLCLGAVAMMVLQCLGGTLARASGMFIAAASGCVIFAGAAIVTLRNSWELERLSRLFMISLFCVYGAFSCTALAQYAFGQPADITAARALIGALSLHGAMLALLPRFLREHQITWRAGFGILTNWRTALLCGVLGALIFLPVGRLLQIVSALSMKQSGWEPKAQTAVQVLAVTDTWSGRIILAFVTILLAPVAEEILFRGILYPAVKRKGHPRLAIYGISLLFAIIHWNPPTFLPLLLLAIMLTRLYETTGNLLAPITVHCLFNAANFAIFYGEPWLPEKFKRLWLIGPF